MNKKSILFLLSALMLFSGCTSSITDNKKERDMKDANHYIIKTSQYPQTTQGTKEFKVYHSDIKTDVEAFKKEYLKLTAEKAPSFDGNMVIAKSGEKRNGGYKISVTEVKDAERYTEVSLLLESPGKGCISTMAITNPYVVAFIPDDHKDVKFIEKSIEVDCK